MIRALRFAMLSAAVALSAGALTATGLTTAGAAAEAAPIVHRATIAKSATAVRSASLALAFHGGLYNQPDSVAAQQAASLAAQGRTVDAAAASYIASRPVAIWLGDWVQGDQLTSLVTRTVQAADAVGKTAVFVTYAIPDRDCGGYSSGGLTNDTYLDWNSRIATALGGHNAVVLVEPDSIAQTTTCPAVASSRLALLKGAVRQFTANGVPSYLDGGNSNWLSATTTAALLDQAGISSARGFFTNVSNFNSLTAERSYADAVSALTGGSRYVIDVSRNGRGARGDWCNPAGAGLGMDPHVSVAKTKLDAVLWVKTPGASDGTCNGGPAAGEWFASYADMLVKNR